MCKSQTLFNDIFNIDRSSLFSFFFEPGDPSLLTELQKDIMNYKHTYHLTSNTKYLRGFHFLCHKCCLSESK